MQEAANATVSQQLLLLHEKREISCIRHDKLQDTNDNFMNSLIIKQRG